MPMLPVMDRGMEMLEVKVETIISTSVPMKAVTLTVPKTSLTTSLRCISGITPISKKHSDTLESTLLSRVESISPISVSMNIEKLERSTGRIHSSAKWTVRLVLTPNAGAPRELCTMVSLPIPYPIRISTLSKR